MPKDTRKHRKGETEKEKRKRRIFPTRKLKSDSDSDSSSDEEHIVTTKTHGRVLMSGMPQTETKKGGRSRRRSKVSRKLTRRR